MTEEKMMKMEYLLIYRKYKKQKMKENFFFFGNSI